MNLKKMKAKANKKRNGGWLFGALGALAGLLFLRTLPDLVRYVKIERM